MKAILLITAFMLGAAVADLPQVRQKFIAAVESAAAADELYSMLEGVPDKSKETTMVAYKAAAIMFQAKYTKGLITKKKLFEKGAQLLDSTISGNPSDYEARLIRLSIQEGAPKITGYKKNIAEDKAFLIKNYNSQPIALKKFTRDFVAGSVSFTKEEKAGF